MTIARAIIGTIGAAIVGLIATRLAIAGWVDSNLATYPVQTICGFVISAAFGGSVVYVFHAAHISRKLGPSPVRNFESLKNSALFSKCATLEDASNAAKLIEEDVRSKDAEISELKRSLEKIAAPQEVRSPSGKLNANMAAIDYLPYEAVAAAVDAFDNGGTMELGDYEGCVRKSIDNGDGLFTLNRFFFMGYHGDETGDFSLTQKWMTFMDDTKVIARMREIASKWKASKPLEWQEIQ